MSDIRRRTFLKGMASIGLAAAVTDIIPLGGASQALATNNSLSKLKAPETKAVLGICTVNCTSRCSLSAHVKDGAIVSVTPGKLPGREDYSSACLRGMSLPWRVQSNDRVKYPMLRVGERGENKFKRISWDEAFELVAKKLNETKDKYGMRSAGFFSMTGNLAKFSWEANYRFADTLEATKFTSEGIMSDHGASMGMQLVYGQIRGAHDTRDYLNSKMLIIWGRNIADTHTSEIRYVLDAKQKGVKVVVIDPRMSSTAAVADQWLAIKPGGDTALALAMMNVIIGKELHDKEWLKTYSCAPLLVREDNGKYLTDNDGAFMMIDEETGKPAKSPEKAALTGSCSVEGVKCKTTFTKLLEEVKKFSPKWAEKYTGIDEKTITELALEYAKNKPCGIRMGQGMQRVSHAHSPFRSVATLAAICGYVGVSGGGASHAGGTAVNRPMPGINIPFYNSKDWTALDGKKATELKGSHIYDMAEKKSPYPLDFLWIACSNFLNQSPDTNRVIKDVFPNISFIVHADPYWTYTARYADLILPANTMWENWDYFDKSPWVTLMQPAIKPIGESRSDIEIFSGIAKRMGLGKYWAKSDEEWVKGYLMSGHPAFEGMTWKKLVKEGISTRKDAIYEPVNAFMDKKFKTQTGKFEFYTEKLFSVKQEVPTYAPLLEDPNGPLAKKYPLMFIQYHDRLNVHTQHMNIPALSIVAKEPWIEINPVDAAKRGIKDGDMVKVFNARGFCVVRSVITEGIIKGVTAIPQGWRPEDFKEGHYQQLTHLTINEAEEIVSETNFAAYDNLVEIVKYRG